MSAETVTAAGRDAALAQMTDACTIARPGTTHTTDPTTGVVTYPGTPIYAGQCRVQVPNGLRGDGTEDAGERQFTVKTAIISVPMTVTGLRVGDMLTVTASSLDPDLVNHQYQIRDITRKSFLTARRLICEETTS